MDSVVDSVKTTYGTKNWEDFLGGSPTGVRNMILWALSAKEVSLTDRLNGITVEQARATGILMLEEVKGSHPTKYIINVPLVALGYDEDLDWEVPLKKLEEVWVDGSSAVHDSMHYSPMNAVPVLKSQEKVIDISQVPFLFSNFSHSEMQGGLFVHNVPKAPSNDCLIVYPPANVEGIQYKSSDNITCNLEPDPSSQGILELGERKHKEKTIWGEFKKVTTANHKKFYSSLDSGASKFNLFVVSNKLLKGYEEVKKAVATKDYNNGLPRGVSVICHQNFQAYAGPFAHRGLYIPLKRKQESNNEEEVKKHKTEDKMEDEM